MLTLTPRFRSRIAVGIVALTVPIGLLTGCAGQAPPPYGGEQDVPTTLAPHPKVRAQPKVTLRVDAPARFLNGYSESSADAVWQQTLDLIRNWTLNPELVQEHDVEKGELNGLLPLFTGEAEVQLRKALHAVPVWLSPIPKPRRAARAQQEVIPFVHWNVHLPSNRGWSNPMFAPVHITDGKIIGSGNLGVMLQLHTALRLRGSGLEYKIPYNSFMLLTWEHVDGEWKIATISRTWSGGTETVTSRRKSGKRVKTATPSASSL